jgi:hypothetical protein
MSDPVSGIVALDGVELIPVVELDPSKFSAPDRPYPSQSYPEVPEEWHRHWSDSLADSGLAGLRPIRRGSWHVATAEFADATRLRKLLQSAFRDMGGVQALCDPDHRAPLNGGLALRSRPQDLLIEPGCCADLGNLTGWRAAVAYKGDAWQELWIGHPWISVKFASPRLILSEQHETDHPTARWAVCPRQLELALAAATVELERFASRIAGALLSLGFSGDCSSIARMLAGLDR